jgi:1-acyl-sn-glycerol-3-phosphate acyltransferase
MVFYSIIPYSSPDCKHQDSPGHLTEEELRQQVKSTHYPWYQLLFQVFTFFVFLGPLRILLAAASFIITFGTILIVRLTYRLIGRDPDNILWIWSFASTGLRLFLVACGIIWYRIEGKVDPRTRIILSNHVGFIDPLVMLSTWRVSYLCKNYFHNIRYLREVMAPIHPVYVDRTKRRGATQQIIDRANDSGSWPLLIFPEGTICQGEVMLQFHRGGFLTHHPIQPIVMKFMTPFLPKRWNTYLWTGQGLLGVFWNMMSMPFSICHLKVLETMTGEEFHGNVEKYALETQLKMANELGIRAVDISSNVLFLVKKPKEEEPASRRDTKIGSEK